MRWADWKVALAATAAVVGAGFASGREVSLFFASHGVGSYMGAVLACAGMGFLTAMVCELSMRTGATTLPGIYTSLLGARWGHAVNALYALLLLLTASVMLATGAQLGLLALPIPGAGWVGMVLTLLVALSINGCGGNALSVVGGAMTLLIAMFYLGLALDGRAVPLSWQTGAIQKQSFWPLALFSGVLYATLNIALAGGVVCLASGPDTRPRYVGVYTAILLALMLFPANIALERAGAEICALALPSVVLAARWGTTGYYISILALWIAVLTTLCAALGSLRQQLRLMRLRGYLAALLPCLLSLLIAMAGFETLVNRGYPIMSWVCALMLLALMRFL